MLKAQRALGLLLVALGGAGEVVALDMGRLDCVVLSHCAAAFGAALYALTMTGRLSDALTALLPVPILAPAAAVLMSWRRGDLSKPAPAPRRVVRFGEAVGLALGLAVVGAGAKTYGPSLVRPRPALAREAPKAAPAVVEGTTDDLGAVLYEVRFLPGKVELTDEGRSILGRVADTMHYYPLDQILLAAAAQSGDVDGTALSLARLEEVRQNFIDHGLDQRRIRTRLEPSAVPFGTVDVLILSD